MAASTCESRWMVSRAKNGMSTSAAIRLAPMRNDTTSAPHAGRCAKRAAREQRMAGAPSLRSANAMKAAAAHRQQHGRRRRDCRRLGLGGGERQDDRAEAGAQQQSTQQVGLRGQRRPATPIEHRAARVRLPQQNSSQQAGGGEGQGREPAGLAGDTGRNASPVVTPVIESLRAPA